jgi:hypothetical protein
MSDLGVFSTAHLMGGLGNQMFQIANSYSQSLDGGIKSYFRPTSQTGLQGKTTENYINNIFKKILFKHDLPSCKRYYEPDWSYNKKKFDWNESIEFYGYYQSSKNFLQYGDKIRELFYPDITYEELLKTKYPKILEDNTLSIHVRMGDYKKFPKTHPVISKSYLDEAIKKIGQYSYLFIFSDDKDWIYNNLKYDNIIIVNDEDYLELWLMSMCKNNIISNSSFSWWASFLNKNKNKKIIAPSIWFGDEGPKNYLDVYESYWEVINLKNKNGELICY